MKWTDEQLKIINHSDKKILVKAGAGTGKTAIIIQRVLKLLEDNPNLNISDIAIITFTNKATEEIQARLKNRLYEMWRYEKNEEKKIRFRRHIEALNVAQISTIHMFCYKILEFIGPFFNEEISYSPCFKVGSSLLYDSIEYTIENWIQNSMNQDMQLEHLSIKRVHQFKNIISKMYSEIRAKGFYIDEVINNTYKNIPLEDDTFIIRLKEELIEILQYLSKEHKKYKYDRLDVDDLLEVTVHILSKRPDLIEIVQQKYKHIIVDEFQDTSLFQTELIKLICDSSKDSPSLFIVGDEKQSIYKFRGADLKSYSKIKEWIKNERDGSVLTLKTNWRSMPDVIYFVNDVFSRLKESNQYEFKHESLLTGKESGESIRTSEAYKWLYGDEKEHGDIVGEFLNKQQEKGKNLGDYCILVRSNYQLPIIEKGLLKNGITDFVIVGTDNFYKQKEITHMYKLLLSFVEQDNELIRKEASNTIFFNSEKEFFNLFNFVRDNKLIYELTPAQLIHLIIKEDIVKRRLSTDELVNLQKLKEKTRTIFLNEHVTLSQYLQWLNLMIVTDQDEETGRTLDVSDSVVQVMTIHRAKGLEFPKVILPFLSETLRKNILYPEFIIDRKTKCIELRYKAIDGTIYTSKNYEESRAREESDTYSEELRVLYVALTRAEEKIILIGEKNNKNKNNFQSWITGI